MTRFDRMALCRLGACGLLLLACSCPLFAQSEFSVETAGNNMVVQREAKNRLAGRAAPGQRVWLEFGGVRERSRADQNGNWEITFNPGEANNLGQSLALYHGPNRKTAARLALANVLVGDVWLVGVPPDRGAPAAVDSKYSDLIRIVSLEFPRLRGKPLTTGIWRASHQVPLQELHALASKAGDLLVRSNLPIGLVQVPRELVERSLIPALPLWENEPDYADVLRTVQLLIGVTVTNAQSAQRREHILLKRAGISTNFISFQPYHEPKLRLRDAFDPRSQAVRLFTFTGAIW